MDYTTLLLTNEWKAKSYAILQRDNFSCQDCGCRGIQNETFFKISSIDDIVDSFLPNSSFNGTKLSMVCKSIDWSIRKSVIHPLEFTSKFIGRHLFIYKMIVHSLHENRFIFATDNETKKLSFKEYVQDGIQLLYNGNQIKCGRLFAFNFEENLGETNYASINYNIINGDNSCCEKLEICILFENQCFFIDFSYLGNKSDLIFKFPHLNVHHNYYIKGRKPWEYDDEVLVTLCSECHQKRHRQINTPVYTSNKKMYTFLPL